MNEKPIDIFDLILSEPIGSFKYFHSEGAETHIRQALENQEEIGERIKHARNSNCLIEVISLRLQNMDMWLRVFYSNTPTKEKRKQEFGPFIRQCFDVGLDKKIYDRLVKFNKDRRVAIHCYLLGQMKYEDFRATVDNSDGLADEIIKFVILNAGEIVTPEHRNMSGKAGDSIFRVRDLIHVLEQNPLP